MIKRYAEEEGMEGKSRVKRLFVIFIPAPFVTDFSDM